MQINFEIPKFMRTFVSRKVEKIGKCKFNN